MATLNGVDLFGFCTVATKLNPVDVQTNAYPGVNGLEELALGTRGRLSRIEGWLVGATVADLNSAEVALRTYQASGLAYTFVDNYGNSWQQVRLLDFEPTGRVMRGAGAGFGACVCRPYTATLLHLV